MEVTKKEVQGESKAVKRPEIDSAIIEELMKGYQRPSDLTGPGGIMEELHKRLYERVLGAELTHYLGYEKGEAPPGLAEGQRRENYRNGSSKKTLLSEGGKLEIDIARDRTGEFEPQFIRKRTEALWRLRYQDHRDVRPGDDGARDQALPGRAV